MTRDDLFNDWKRRAGECDILAEAIARGAKLKRAGKEWVGSCPMCGGTDRFSVNPQKRVFNCRGAEGGSVINMVMHVHGITFIAACETLTGEPNPSGRASKPLTADEIAERERRRTESETAHAAHKAQQERYESDTKESAAKIWLASVPVVGTLAEKYLIGRGLVAPKGNAHLRFNAGLTYTLDGQRKQYPCLVSRIDDLSGELTAIQSVYLDPVTGRKANLSPSKVTTGPCGGGAVRLGGIAPHINICEGVETGIAIGLMTNFKAPTWCTLGTSGLVNVELPLIVQKVTIWPDGDKPYRKHDGEFVPTIPAGRKAALALSARLKAEGVQHSIAFEPPLSKDYADVWNASRMEVA